MQKKKFIEAVESVGLKLVGDAAYGKIGEFPVRVSRDSRMGGGIHVTFSLERDVVKSIRKELRGRMKKIGGVAPVGKDHLQIYINRRLKKFAEQYRTMSDIVSTVFAENSVRPSVTCPFCKQDGCDVIAHHKTGYQAVHRSCLEKAVGKIKEDVENNLANGSYLLGIIGAVIGGFLACLVNAVSTLIFADMSYALYYWKYALIPVGIYYGYKLFKGKMNKLVIAITSVLSLIFFLGVDIMIVYEYTLLGYYDIPLKMLPSQIATTEFLTGYLTSDSVYALVCIVGGILAIRWELSHRDGRAAAVNAEEAMKTVIPLERAETVRR